MTLRRPEPGSFEHLLVEARVDPTHLVRLSRRPQTEPWWSRGVYRFDGPPTGEPHSFGTCYMSESIDVAFAESVIHESSRFIKGRFAVPMTELNGRHIVRFALPAPTSAPALPGTPGAAPGPALVLADLTGAALKQLGLNNDISAGSDYDMTMLWALAVHQADPKWDGIRYVSRQRNDATAIAVFERSGLVLSSARPLSGVGLGKLCDQFNVVALPP